MAFGLCISPRIFPDQAALAELDPPFLRSILYRDEDLDVLLAMGRPLWLTINNEWGRLAGWDIMSACWYLASKQTPDRRIWRVSLGNEFDHWWQDNPSDVPPAFAAGLVNAGGPTLKNAGIEVFTTSVVGRTWPAYLDQMVPACRGNLSGIDFHGYGQRPDGWGQPGWGFGELAETLAGIRDRHGLPVGMSEYGVEVRDAGSEGQQAAWIVAAGTTLSGLGVDAAYFSYHDLLGKPGEWWDDGHGLLRPDGSKRPAWSAYREAARVEPAPVPAPAPEPEPVMAFPEGIDVSNNNGAINWDAVAGSGVAFAIAKITEGTWFRDGYFRENWAAMKRLGIYRGAYHFARPSVRSAAEEADYFLEAFELLGCAIEPGDLLALDLEDPDVAPGSDLSGYTLAWLERVEERAGFKPLCYTSPGYAREHRLGARPEIGAYGLWLASWGVSTPPAAVAPWDLVAVHQFAVTGAGSVPGVAGEIDRNRFNGPAAAIPKYGKPGDVPAPAPVPEPAPGPRYTIGEGILAAMAARGAQPASDEIYQGASAWSEAYDTAGRRYVYLPAVNRVFVYEPAA